MPNSRPCCRDLFSESIAHSIFGLTDFALDFPERLFRGAFELGLLIADDLTNGLFHSTLDFVTRPPDPIFVHRSLLFIFFPFITTRMAATPQLHWHSLKQ